MLSLDAKCECAWMTQADVARVMTERGHPMTRVNVVQTERRALKKLKKLLADLYEQEFLS